MDSIFGGNLADETMDSRHRLNVLMTVDMSDP